jgi:hypothetical protein
MAELLGIPAAIRPSHAGEAHYDGDCNTDPDAYFHPDLFSMASNVHIRII